MNTQPSEAEIIRACDTFGGDPNYQVDRIWALHLLKTGQIQREADGGYRRVPNEKAADPKADRFHPQPAPGGLTHQEQPRKAKGV